MDSPWLFFWVAVIVVIVLVALELVDRGWFRKE